MHLKVLYATVICLAGVVVALAATNPVLHLRGDRFKPLTYDQLTQEQKTMVDHIMATGRPSLDGPFNVMLRSPEMGDMAQQFGAYTRFHTSLPHKLNEFVILITGRAWNAQFEWYAHKKYALQAGLSQSTIDALAAGTRPPSMQPDEEAVYNFCTELLTTKQVSDATFKAAVDKFGERGVVDMIGVIGYYHLVSMLLNVDRYPLPEGVTPELKPLN